MKKLICVCLIVLLMVPMCFSLGESGLLPSLTETVGVGMPSLGEALQRYPDSETENEDGSVTELYTNVSESDFNTFSVYLEQQEAQLADYHVEGSELAAEIRAKGASFSLSYDTKTGEAKVTYPVGTFSEWMKNAKAHFDAGQKLLDEGKTNEAYAEFLVIPQYSKYAPVEKLLQNDDDFIIAAREATFSLYRTPGNTVFFGRYEQDNNMANGPEEIEWIVLDYDEKEHKALLLSKYGLDAKQYNWTNMHITWEWCSLRKWMSGEFLQAAFSMEEQAVILTAKVDNSDSQRYSKWDISSDITGGRNTQDQVFLLSYAEAKRYLNVAYDDNNNTRVRVAPTAYAIAQGASVRDSIVTEEEKPAGSWWLRSPGVFQIDAALVNEDGSLVSGNVDDIYAIRPALWLNLESEYFK